MDIPCEFCGDLISPYLYNQHAYRCRDNYISENIDDNYFDNDNVLEGYITSNRQLHRTNIRDFIQTHSSPTNGHVYITNLYRNRTSSNVENIHNDVIHINDINNISVVVCSKSDVLNGVCPICQCELNELFEDRIKIRQMKCFHTFCHNCITKWLEKHDTCPICLHKFNINTETNTNIVGAT